MNINEKVIAAVKQVIPVCVPNFYDGDKDEYAEFEVDTYPDWYTDDAAQALRYDILLRVYAPRRKNTIALRSKLLQVLSDAGFTLQFVDDTSDDLSQCYEYYLKLWTTADSPEV